MQRIAVALPDAPYEVVVGSGVLAAAGEFLPTFAGAQRAFVVCDRDVGDRLLGTLADALDDVGLSVVHLGVPKGEEAKTLDVAEALYRLLATQEAHRGEPIIALGGGTVGDLAGFVAATYMRGVPLVQVPTTLTAQVDAAIGGKTAVDLPEGKNLVGAFHQPSAVLADVSTLTTLPDRDYRSGLSEVAKYAVTLDAGLRELLETQVSSVISRDPDVMEDLVARCVSIKARAVVADERDTGQRLILNYGHTLGHAIERVEQYSGRTHGEAIAEGMVFAARLSERIGMAPDGLAQQHGRLLASLGIDTGGPLPSADALIAAMHLDKKFQGGVRFVLLRAIDEPEVVEGVSEDDVRATLREMGASV